MNLKLRSKRFLNEVFTKKCQYSEKRSGFSFFFFVCFTIIIETINDFFTLKGAVIMLQQYQKL
ncbi:hypothetical protein JG559_14070 [Enterococcus faecalis]|uniref:Uncharacterized protein n=1 Tax=Enterococcus faecalis TaxID=1351 RepID=A0A974S7E1_ENTFL|nr:hypothetical protein JG559_14070 [Enterococcus faecalis]